MKGAYNTTTKEVACALRVWGTSHKNPYDLGFAKWLEQFDLTITVFNGATMVNRGVVFEAVVKALLGCGNVPDYNHGLDIPQLALEVKFVSPKSKACACACHKGARGVVVGLCTKDGVKVIKVSPENWAKGNLQGENFNLA
jgi:hypothetical protein